MELNDFNGLDLPSQLKLFPSYELRSKLSGIPNLDNFDIEENHIRAVNSNYHSFSGPKVCFAWLQMELCRAANIKSKVSILGFR